MIALVFIALCIYYFLASFVNRPVVKRPTQDPPPAATLDDYTLYPDGTLQTSNGSVWKIPSHQDHYFSPEGRIDKKDECFGKPDDFKVLASGKRLYEYVHDLRQKNSPLLFHFAKFTKKGKQFYFRCRGGRVRDMHACDSGSTFEGTDCAPINPCTDRRDGETFADNLDKHYYYRCYNGVEVHKKCPHDRFFIGDRCAAPDTCDTSYAINKTHYVRCVEGRPVLSKCPPGSRFFPDTANCDSDLCDGSEDGIIPMPRARSGPFLYSEGYIECKAGRVVKRKTCPAKWDSIHATQENLLHLPEVFDGQSCKMPSLCENVFPVDADKTIVPVYEFTKYAREWTVGKEFDNAVGFKCQAKKKTRVSVQPGNTIRDFREVPACDSQKRAVVMGDKIDRFYDCSTGKEAICPPDTSFNGKECSEKQPLAHKIKGKDVILVDGLSQFNGWMKPPAYATTRTAKCEPEMKYIQGYNVCAEPECEKYPFLKQVEFQLYTANGTCVYRDRKIVKVENEPDTTFNFWEQRETYETDNVCVPGQKTKSGYFTMDCCLYATCNLKQPFVFCPSPYTKGIIKNSKGDYACEPEDRVYKGIVPAKTRGSFYHMELESFVPKAAYSVNRSQKVYNGSTISVAEEKRKILTLESDKDIELNYRTLITYPLQNYFYNKQLSHFDDNYILKEHGSTKYPLRIDYHNVKQV